MVFWNCIKELQVKSYKLQATNLMKNKIAILDAKVIANNQTLALFDQFGEVSIWQTTKREERIKHIGDANMIS